MILISDISKDKWEKMTAANNWNSVELRDNRYNQIVHMVSAANGAEDFYSTEVRRQTDRQTKKKRNKLTKPNQKRSFSHFIIFCYVRAGIGARMPIRGC